MVATKRSIIVTVLLAVAVCQVSCFTSPLPRTADISRASRVSFSQRNLQQSPLEQNKADDEIERLKSMAQKLRAEASALEADRAQVLAVAAESVFRKFDTNKDGEISIEELKAGLEKALKIELSEKRVEQVMKDFDKTGDGKLLLGDMVGLEKFSNKLEALARDEKNQALVAKKESETEAQAALLAEARLKMLNDQEPTTRDKLFSVLPYLFPLMDSLQFGRFLIQENPENIFVGILAVLYNLYRAVPFSGFIAFFALNVLSSRPGINRLIRFNMQQAIFVDIALFFPGLLGAAYGLLAANTAVTVPAGFAELGSDAVFGAVIITIAYCSISSLFGQTPDKIPVISPAVEDRMPSVDMFDDSGSFIPREKREKKDEDDDKKN